MTALLASLTEVAASLLTKVGDVFGLVETEPVLQIGLGIFVVGAAVGLVTRIIRAF